MKHIPERLSSQRVNADSKVSRLSGQRRETLESAPLFRVSRRFAEILSLCLRAFVVCFFLAACAPLATPGVTPSAPAPTATPLFPTFTPAPRETPIVLRVWLPPRFDPQTDALLRARLDDFASAHPSLKIETRLKAEDLLLDSLQLTSDAAPSILPDLVALPRAGLERAAALNLLQPLTLPDDSGWTLSARALGRAQDADYGFPFAMDALALASASRDLGAGWADIVSLGPLTFNRNDASFALALYLAAGGPLDDGQGHAALDESTLARVLTLFAQESVVGVDSDEAAWESLGQEGGGYAVGWLTSLRGRARPEVRLEALPGFDASPATLARGWMWAVATPDVERQALAIELAQWLTEAEFLAAWSESTGWLSPRDPAWATARVFPTTEVLPALAQAVTEVLGGASPEEAARRAAEQLR